MTVINKTLLIKKYRQFIQAQYRILPHLHRRNPRNALADHGQQLFLLVVELRCHQFHQKGRVLGLI
jgi:hypothetical protein